MVSDKDSLPTEILFSTHPIQSTGQASRFAKDGRNNGFT
jgi:hypothetical protein